MTDGYNQNKELKPLKTLGLLEKLLVAGMITEEEYKERKTVYVESLLELYCFGIISREQMEEKLNC